MDDLKLITSKIRIIRILKGVKIQTMAKKLGISQGEYSKIENNQRKSLIKHLYNICKILDIEMEDLNNPIDIKNLYQ
jgi:transcriptional regulator with XRE-family HTH domain